MLADVAILVDVPSFLLIVGKNIALFWQKRHVQLCMLNFFIRNS
jgi:hypothetical protein